MATKAGGRLLRNHPHITSAKDMDEWVQKLASFADIPYSIYTDIVQRVGGSEKLKKLLMLYMNGP